MLIVEQIPHTRCARSTTTTTIARFTEEQEGHATKGEDVNNRKGNAPNPWVVAMIHALNVKQLGQKDSIRLTPKRLIRTSSRSVDINEGRSIIFASSFDDMQMMR